MVAKAADKVGKSGKVKKVVLAYSGGLDTSIILKWLQDEYGCEVVTFTADLGQVSYFTCIEDGPSPSINLDLQSMEIIRSS